MLDLVFEDSISGDLNYCCKSFMSEIISPNYPEYLNLDDFLTSEEQDLLYPEYKQYGKAFDDYRHIDPLKLKTIFVKIYIYLRDNHERFPLTHIISENNTGFPGGGSSDRFIYEEKECYLDGFHHIITHRNDLCLMSWNDGWKPLKWIKVSDKLEIENKIFYIKTSNKFEEYKDILQALIDICQEGIKTNKRLRWLYST